MWTPKRSHGRKPAPLLELNFFEFLLARRTEGPFMFPGLAKFEFFGLCHVLLKVRGTVIPTGLPRHYKLMPILEAQL